MRAGDRAAPAAAAPADAAGTVSGRAAGAMGVMGAADAMAAKAAEAGGASDAVGVSDAAGGTGAVDAIDATVPPAGAGARPARQAAARGQALFGLWSAGVGAERPARETVARMAPAMPLRRRATPAGRAVLTAAALDDGEADAAAWATALPDAMPLAPADLAVGVEPSGHPGRRGRRMAGGAAAAAAGARWRAGFDGFDGFGGDDDDDRDREPAGGRRPRRIAVVADPGPPPLRPPKLARPGLLPALRPKSRADCERRCGSDGFCDPSDPLGCGGVHCGRRGAGELLD